MFKKRNYGYAPRTVCTPRREDLEHNLQKEICTFLDYQSAHLPMLYFAVPNALKFLSTLKDTRRISAAYSKMRAEGFKDGVSDLVVLVNWNKTLKIGFFEQKRPATYKTSESTGKRIINTAAGKPTNSQLAFLEEVRKLGAYGAVSYTLDEFQTHWREFLAS